MYSQCCIFFQVATIEEDGTFGCNNLPCLIQTCEAKYTFSNKTFPHKAQLLDQNACESHPLGHIPIFVNETGRYPQKKNIKMKDIFLE